MRCGISGSRSSLPRLYRAAPPSISDYPKSESRAFTDTGNTRAGTNIEPLAARHPGESGFLLQSDGIDALATRILLSERAERSLDAQYYLITNDVTGLLFIEALLRAADRGRPRPLAAR